MIASSTATSRNGSAKAGAFPEHFQSLRDRFLLHLRDGEWRPVADLAAWLAPRVPAELAVHRFHEANGMDSRKLDHKCGEGQKLLLKDIIDTLRSKNLLAVRGDRAGEEVRATP